MTRQLSSTGRPFQHCPGRVGAGTGLDEKLHKFGVTSAEEIFVLSTRVSVGLALSLSAVSIGAITMTTGGAGASIGPDVVISELMIDPKDVYDSRGEWIELLNRGDAPADLAGWRITDGRSENVVLPALTVAPGERVVLARFADPYVNGGVTADWVYGNQIVLYNDADRVILTNDNGAEEDRVDWYPEQHLTVPVGRSLALARPDAPGSDPAELVRLDHRDDPRRPRQPGPPRTSATRPPRPS